MSDSSFQYTPQGTITGSSTSKLSQDAIVATTVPVYPSPSPIAAFVNLSSGFTEALAVTVDQSGAPQLAHMTRSAATGSESAWATNLLGATAHEVAAGTAFLGVAGTQQVYGFYHDGVSLYGIQLDGETWTSGGSPLGDAITGLKVAYSPAGVLVLYGVGGDGNLVTYWQTPGSPFTGVEWSLPVSADVQLVLNDGTDATNWQASSIANGQLTIAQGQFIAGMGSSAEPSSVSTVPDSNASQVVLGFWNSSLVSPAFLYLDGSGTLNSYCGQSVAIQQNVTIASAAGYQGNNVAADGTPYTSIHLYSIDANKNLSVLHQDANDPFDATTGAPNFTQLLPLTTGVTSVVSDMNPADVPTLFAVDDQQLVPGVNMVRLHFQDAQTNYWRTDYMYTPAGTPFEVTRYRSEVTIVDGYGIPVPNFPLTLSIGSQYSAVDIAAGGQSYYLSSSTPVSLQTNPHGKLTFSVIANSGLAIPAIDVAGNGISLTVQANSEIHNYLAGTGTLNGKDAFNATTLGAATDANGNSIITNQTNVSNAAAGLTQIGQAAQNLSNNSGGSTQTDSIFGFHIDMRDKANPKFTAFHDQASYDALMKSVAMESFGLFDWISDFAKDVVHGVEQAVTTVEQVVVTVAKGIATIALQVYGATVNLVIKTLEDVAHAISTAFMWVVKSIEDVINWLKAIFNMGAIIRTMNAFQTALTQMIGDGTPETPGYINTSLVSYTSQAQTWLSNQQTTINNYLGTLAGSQSTFGGLPGFSAPGVPSSSSIGSTSVSPSSCTSNVHHNFFQEKVSSSNASGGSADNGLSGASASFSQNLQTAFGDFTTAFGTFLTAVKDVIENPASIESQGMGLFISALQGIIDGLFAFAQAVLGELASLASAVTTTIAALLNTNIDSSFLQAIWSFIGGSGPLTISAVISLLAAFPSTIIYTLITGSEPFPDPSPAAMDASASISPLPLIAAVMEILYIIPAGISLALGPTSPWYLTVLLVALSALIFFFSGRAKDYSTEDWDDLGAAAVNLAFFIPAVYIIVNGAEAQPTVSTLKDIGKCVITLGGALSLIAASIAAAENSTPPPTPYDTANNILFSLPNLFAFLRTSAATKAFPEGAPALSGAIMTVGYVGGGIAGVLGND